MAYSIFTAYYLAIKLKYIAHFKFHSPVWISFQRTQDFDRSSKTTKHRCLSRSIWKTKQRKIYLFPDATGADFAVDDLYWFQEFFCQRSPHSPFTCMHHMHHPHTNLCNCSQVEKAIWPPGQDILSFWKSVRHAVFSILSPGRKACGGQGHSLLLPLLLLQGMSSVMHRQVIHNPWVSEKQCKAREQRQTWI